MKGRVITAPTARQKKAVDNILSGKYNHLRPALRDAGYKDVTALAPKKNFLQAQGVKIYLKTLSKVAKRRFNLSLPDKVALTYLDGLEADKPYGKDGDIHPDYQARLAYADRFAKFFGWMAGEDNSPKKMQQFNFFSLDDKTKEDFNNNFKSFLKQTYS
jgi:hypothetical protein